MYRLIRNIHLALGTFFCLFVLLYGVSSIPFAHSGWIPSEPAVTKGTIPVDPVRAADPRAVARQIMRRAEYRGMLRDVRRTPEGFRFRIVRFGAAHEVAYRPGAAEAQVTTRTMNWMGTLIRMHVIAGVRQGSWVYDAWGWLVVLTSAALLLLGVTGVYLWYKTLAERRVGLVLISAGILFSLTLLAWIRVA